MFTYICVNVYMDRIIYTPRPKKRYGFWLSSPCQPCQKSMCVCVYKYKYIYTYTHIRMSIYIYTEYLYIYSKKQPGCWPLCLAILHDVYVSKVTFYGNGIGDVRQGSRPWVVRISWHHSPAAVCEAWELPVIGGLEKDLGNDYCHIWGNSLEIGV